MNVTDEQWKSGMAKHLKTDDTNAIDSIDKINLDPANVVIEPLRDADGQPISVDARSKRPDRPIETIDDMVEQDISISISGEPTAAREGAPSKEVFIENAAGFKERSKTIPLSDITDNPDALDASEETSSSSDDQDEGSTMEKARVDNEQEPSVIDDVIVSEDDDKTSLQEATTEQTGSEGKAQHVAPKKKSALKKAFIVVAACIGVLACTYFIGVFTFTSHYLPNTFIADVDASMQTQEEVESELVDEVSRYELKVSGQGLDAALGANDVGLHIDASSAAGKLMAMQDPWAWPMQIFDSRNGTPFFAEAVSFGDLTDTVADFVALANEGAVQPANAYVAFNPETALYEVVDEVAGDTLDVAVVEERITDAVSELETSIVLDEDVLLAPDIYGDDETLSLLADEANKIASSNIVLTLDGADIATISKDVIVPWIAISEANEVALDEAVINDWVAGVAAKCNSSGRTHTYRRADGKNVTVSGGSYGRRIDSDSLLFNVLEAIKTGKQETLEIPLANSVAGGTGRSWGRYVDVDLSEQYARFYDANDALLWESPIVSGARGKNDTPTGVYTLNTKTRGEVLRGPMTDGKYAWESYVDYWMPFVGSSVGLHDANWQSAFGGTRFMDGFGSHGCVNLPSGSAASLFGLIQVGDVVVVHY